MALGATVYAIEVRLADADRQVYETLNLRVARHPSETAEYLWTRVLAYALEYTEGIAFSRGLSDTDLPAISVHDLTGAWLAWIEVGAPDAARLHRAAKLAPRVAVYLHKDPELALARWRQERIHRAEHLVLRAFDPPFIAALAARLDRRLSVDVSVAEDELYLSLGGETLSAPVRRLNL